MKKSRFTETEILKILKEAEIGSQWLIYAVCTASGKAVVAT